MVLKALKSQLASPDTDECQARLKGADCHAHATGYEHNYAIQMVVKAEKPSSDAEFESVQPGKRLAICEAINNRI